MRNHASAVVTPRLLTENSKEAYNISRTIHEVACERTVLFEGELGELLDARKMTEA